MSASCITELPTVDELASTALGLSTVVRQHDLERAVLDPIVVAEHESLEELVEELGRDVDVFHPAPRPVETSMPTRA